MPFALLADHLPFIVTRFDRERRHVYVNRAIALVTQRDPVAFIGKTNAELGMPAHLVELWHAAIDRAFTGEPAVLQFEWQGSDAVQTFAAEILPERDEQGAIHTVLGITRDITAEVTAQRALAAAAEERVQRLELEHQRLSAMFAESLAAVSVVRGPDFRLELLNPRAKVLWGRGDEVVGQPLLVALPELAGQGFEELLRGVVDTGTVYRGHEVPIRIDRGGAGQVVTHYFDFVYAPLRNLDGVVDGVIVHAHDVSEKVDARERMQLAIEATGVGIWEWNVITGEVRWDRQMRAIYGVPADTTVTYDTWRSAVAPEEIAAQEAILEDTVRRCGRSTRQFRIRRADDGQLRDIACVETVRVNRAGQPEWVVGTNLDVTERLESETRSRRLTTELAEADRRKDEFLATLAHELRNPLAPIRNGLAVLRSSPEAAERTFGMMDRQLSHLVRLVDDLLDISRVRSGKITLSKEPLGVREIVEIAIEACRPTIDGHAHALSLDVTTEPLVVSGDRTRLVQIVANLVTNAAKYTERGGRIVVSVQRDGDTAVIRVADTGVGIAPDVIPTLWDMFTQVRDTLEKAQGGLGIGLSLAKKLVDLHGGTIRAESAGLGTGSTFEVRLPLAATVAAAPVAPAPAVQDVAKPTKRILVVDDNVDGAETLSMLLELGGHELAVAHSGPDALDAVNRFAPEIVFLDIGLPGMDGYEVARHLRADPGKANIVLVALTGWGSAADQQRSRDAGFDTHLTKPIQFAVIEEILARFSAR